MQPKTVEASFRDPSGFVFLRDGLLLRQVNRCYAADYDQLMESGLYRELTEAALLVPHEEVEGPASVSDDGYRVIQPERIPFVSYPYEWCFSQLRDAALTTLEIQRRALRFGMSLKDASAFNIQFHQGKSVLIDTLSFESYAEGSPWVAYGQFCRHFLAPLALMAHRDPRLGLMGRGFIDGIPLDLAARLLPRKTLLRPSLAVHLHLHARAQRRYQATSRKPSGRVSRQGFLGIIGSLRSAVAGLRWTPRETPWADYYRATNYSEEAELHKEELVARFAAGSGPRMIWDLGANTGRFSRTAALKNTLVVAFDADPAAVEANYREVVRNCETRILPLQMDLTNPSPSLGWNHGERDSLRDRGPAELVLALALAHHLAIGNNVPLPSLAAFLAGICRSLVIEWVPKEDSQIQRMLRSRRDIFGGYTLEGFRQAFAAHFRTLEEVPIRGSLRRLFWMRRDG
jgi:hypothetical protein